MDLTGKTAHFRMSRSNKKEACIYQPLITKSSLVLLAFAASFQGINRP